MGEIGHTQEGKWRTGVLDTHEYTISNNVISTSTDADDGAGDGAGADDSSTGAGAGATDESKRNDSYGIIYCIPYNSQYILTINTITDHVELLTMHDCNNMGDDNDNHDKIQKWTSGVQALDGCIYCMPAYASHILKIDPTAVYMDMDNNMNMNMNMDNNMDEQEGVVTVKGVSVTSVGMKFEWGWKYFDTILGIDGCIYGIPNETKSIFKYDTVTNVCSIVGGERDDCFYCDSGVLGRGGRFIYALRKGVGADDVSGGGNGGNGNEVVKIDTLKNQYSVIQVKLDEDEDKDQHNHKSNSNGNSTNEAPFTYYCGWKNAVLGNDGCIYFPPYNANRTLKYDPYMDSLPQSSSSSSLTSSSISSSNSNSRRRRRSPFSLVGKDFGNQQYKWLSGVSLSAPVSISTLTSTSPHQNKSQNRDGNGHGHGHGATYCIPNRADQIMIIDPYKEFANNLQDRARACTPMEMVRFLFAADDDYDYDEYYDDDDDRSQRSCSGEHGCESGVNTITLSTSTSTSTSRTFITAFESAIQKYGRSNVFHLLDECIAFSPEGSCKGIIPLGDKEEHDERLQLPLFMEAASCKHSASSVIYHFLRKDPSVLVSYIHP